MAARRRLAAVFALASSTWAVLLLAVPWGTSAESRVHLPAPISASVYLMGAIVCHQRAERSFHPWGVRMPVCARCFGLYASAPAGAAVGLAAGVVGLTRRRLTTRTARWGLLVASLPTAVIWLIEWLGVGGPSAFARAIAAVPLGAAVGWLATAAIAGEIE